MTRSRSDEPVVLGDGAWRTVARLGQIGRRAQAVREGYDRLYGPGRWRIAYRWRGEIIPRGHALDLYTDAYTEFLRGRPEMLGWLVTTARDVYDIAPDDTASGTDYTVQTQQATHLQDIAIRIAVARLGRRFQGHELIQVRGKKSKGACLSPGVVPFHLPDAIERPELRGWWRPGSVESFWQSNKVLQIQDLGEGCGGAQVITLAGPGAACGRTARWQAEADLPLGTPPVEVR